MDASEQELIANFCAVTGASPSSAQTALASANGNLQEAVALWYAAQEEQQDDMDEAQSEGEAELPQATTAPPTSAVPTASSSSSNPSRKPPPQRSNRMTLDDLKKREEHSDEEEDDPKKGPDMYTGGEKSGLAVENPGQAGGPPNHYENIMKQARQNRDRPAGSNNEAENTPAAARAPQSSAFSGRAQTLGGDDAPSEVVEDPSAMARTRQQQQTAQRVTRTLHLWADGVSIDDGPLFRFDDPANANIMAEINRGRAPLALLDVQPDQEVDLNLEPHKDENYVKPKQKWKPFGGSGQRLGSPVPSAGTSSTSTTAAPPASSSSSSSTTNSTSQAPDLDTSTPTLNLQIRLGDGTRLTSRFNTTHTVADVYAFVNAASPASAQRGYALMTTFPSKELGDRGQVLGEIGEFRGGRGGVVVQKWT